MRSVCVSPQSPALAAPDRRVSAVLACSWLTVTLCVIAAHILFSVGCHRRGVGLCYYSAVSFAFCLSWFSPFPLKGVFRGPLLERSNVWTVHDRLCSTAIVDAGAALGTWKLDIVATASLSGYRNDTRPPQAGSLEQDPMSPASYPQVRVRRRSWDPAPRRLCASSEPAGGESRARPSSPVMEFSRCHRAVNGSPGYDKER